MYLWDVIEYSWRSNGIGGVVGSAEKAEDRGKLIEDESYDRMQ